MLSFIKKYFIVILLFFLVIILIFLKIFYSDKTQNQIAVVEPTPTSTIEPTPTIELSIDVIGNYPLYKLIPYKTEDFIVSGYVEPLILDVKTLNKSKTKTEMEDEIKLWINNNGIDSNTHKIIWDWVDENDL